MVAYTGVNPMEKDVMPDSIRIAQIADVPAIVELAEQKRLEYQSYQPVFWRKAANSRERHIPWVEKLVNRDDVITLVHERDGIIDGFIIADFVPAPPVYDVAGPTCRVDDYTVADSQDWQAIGRELLEEVMREAQRRGAAQIVVVCAHLDQPKRAMLAAAGLSLASEWYTKPL
jgi:GNAT superfamily N-acetyltransferase